MMRSIVAVIVFIFLYAGYAVCGDTYYNFGNSGGGIQQGGTGTTQGRDGVTGGTRITRYYQNQNGHNDYWCSYYRTAVAYAEKGYYNPAIKICNEVIRKGDSTHRSKCSALERQIYHQR